MLKFKVVGHYRLIELRDVALLGTSICRGQLGCFIQHSRGIALNLAMDDVLSVTLHSKSLASTSRTVDENCAVLTVNESIAQI